MMPYSSSASPNPFNFMLDKIFEIKFINNTYNSLDTHPVFVFDIVSIIKGNN